MTGVRLLALHNLAYLERLVRGARETIHAGGFAGYRERILGGAAPWAALTAYGS
jgi:queuine/archaeosine tRNA-ribosyltransferase